jgi:hypothetical protein
MNIEMLEKTEIHIFIFSILENSAVYGIMWENTVQSDRPQKVLRRDPQNPGYLYAR